MNLIRSLLGRRQFLIAFIGSTLTLAYGRVSKAFDLLFQMGVAKVSAKPETGKQKPLKGIIVYYSAGGCTAQIANALWRGMKSVIACDVAPIKKVRPADMAKYDVMAIGAPNWYMREPANIKIFTHDMPRMDGKHCIIFGTHGMMPIGQFWSMSRNMLKKGMTIIGWNDWFGECKTYGSQPHHAAGHPDEIDLAEAESFGRQMAENSIKIFAGERDLIPEIPTPEGGQMGNLWSPRVDALGNLRFAEPPPNSIPEFDLTKCVYPRCTQCIGNCPVNAIDFSVTTPAGSLAPDPITATPLVLKEACQHCGGICERVCLYDAINYPGEEYKMVIHMTKCTYPKCTECLEVCPQDAIDFSVDPPIFHNWCENGDYTCFDVCPENAIEYINHDAGHWWTRGGRMPLGLTPPTGEEGEAAQAFMMTSNLPGFRLLIPEEEVGSKGPLMSFTTYPRVVLNKELWVYHMDEG